MFRLTIKSSKLGIVSEGICKINTETKISDNTLIPMSIETKVFQKFEKGDTITTELEQIFEKMSETPVTLLRMIGTQFKGYKIF